MHVPHSIRLTIQLTIDSESFRELTNTTQERSGSTISFTKKPFLRQLWPVGRLLAACLFLADLPHAYGQDQEHQLLNRLLKPDMSLQNVAQNKKFIVVKGTSLDKHAATGTFYLEKKSNSKRFSGPRDFSTWQFNARSFRGGDKAADFSSRQQITNSNRSFSTQAAHNLHDAHESGRTAGAGTFVGSRPFLDQGKSQKALSRQNPPLTIDQVRELLNKNK
jgi:hypothetical protein